MKETYKVRLLANSYDLDEIASDICPTCKFKHSGQCGAMDEFGRAVFTPSELAVNNAKQESGDTSDILSRRVRGRVPCASGLESANPIE